MSNSNPLSGNFEGHTYWQHCTRQLVAIAITLKTNKTTEFLQSQENIFKRINLMNMDWAEELKMSIRKTTARKGRRSKSRDLHKDTAQTTASSSSLGQLAGSSSTDLAIDITLDMQSQKQSHQSTSTSNNVSTSQAGSDNTSSTFNSSSEFNRPPAFRRISGGWADLGVGNKIKSKKGSFEDERFDLKSSAKNSPSDEIPVIPDLDDIKDDNLMNEINKPASLVSSNG